MSKKLISLIILLMSNFAQGSEVAWNLTFDNEFNLPLVTINIKGENVVLGLDTGSKKSLHLPINLIDKIKNKTEQSHKIKSMDLSGNINESRSFIINNLTLNSFHFKKINVVEYKDWGMVFSSDSSSDNKDHKNINIPVIGLGLFDDYMLTINYPERKIIITDENDIPANLDEKWVSMPFHLNEEGLVIEMTDDIKNYKMILDSGASISIIKEQSLSPQTVKINEDDSDYQLVSLQVNNILTDKIEAIILDSFPAEFQSDGLLGFDFLSKNLVKIDFKNKKLWIQAEVQ